ncbi:HD domain-containing protein [Ferruginibacter sp. SUN106]|uniref:HD domain-containing protein n=1 Tax=Ferruginibacter sp. SUN106 TaxID=2978348 RepID=UPI003D36ED4B
MLKETFIRLIGSYSTDDRLAKQLWQEIEDNYTNKKRHYHTLQHLENLLPLLLQVKDSIKDWNTILFSFYYHDVVYNALKRTNEEKSAEFARIKMQLIGIRQPMIEKCVQQIMATKDHLVSGDTDTNFFTDADLSILGQPWEIYELYFKNVRKEYSLYPDLIYNPGRKKVLQHFLQMERIFKTDFFFNKFELQAKENLQREIELL